MDGDGYIPASKVPLIADAVNNACDALDGVKDGVLNDPRRCHFDPAMLPCKRRRRPDLPDQRAGGCGEESCGRGSRMPTAIRSIPAWCRAAKRDPAAGPTGSPERGRAKAGTPTWACRSSSSWCSTIPIGISGPSSSRPRTASTTTSISPTLNSAPLFNATDPDLSAFKASGGKADPVSRLERSRYHAAQQHQLLRERGEGDGPRRQSRVPRHARVLSPVHGAGHAALRAAVRARPASTWWSALDQWVEHGVAPEQIIASHMTNGVADRTRPLCAYPYEAQWKGSGSTDKAENFACVLAPR